MKNVIKDVTVDVTLNLINNIIVKISLRDDDLTYHEKSLLIQSLVSIKSYFKVGNVYHIKYCKMMVESISDILSETDNHTYHRIHNEIEKCKHYVQS